MSAWRAAGLNYINFSTIAAKILRQTLKSEFKADVIKRNTSNVKVTPWIDGKAQKAPPTPSSS